MRPTVFYTAAIFYTAAVCYAAAIFYIAAAFGNVEPMKTDDERKNAKNIFRRGVLAVGRFDFNIIVCYNKYIIYYYMLAAGSENP